MAKNPIFPSKAELLKFQGLLSIPLLYILPRHGNIAYHGIEDVFI
jgi:hypothetical protein